jgi:hypothetical protein
MYLKNIVKHKEPNNSGIMVIFTKPWFVIGIVVTCFAILTPKIFIPLFKQIFGLNKPAQDPNNDFYMDKMPPHLRMRHSRITPPRSSDGDEFSRSGPGPQFGRSGPSAAPSYTPQSGSSSKSMLSFLLPVYAVGIGFYMIYTLFKVFNKNEDEKKGKDEDSDYDDNKAVGLKFRERNSDPSFIWDANNGEFKYKTKSDCHFPRSEESEDEANDYERYKELDPEYVAYLKERRRLQRNEQRKANALITKTASPIDKENDTIPLSSNIGMNRIC